MNSRTLLLSLALGTAAVIAVPAHAQYQDQDQNGQYQRSDRDRDYDRMNQHDRIDQQNGQNGTYDRQYGDQSWDRERQYSDQDRDRDRQYNDQYGDRDRQYGNNGAYDRSDRDRQPYVNSDAYQQGLREGMRDRNHNRQANPRNADQWSNDTDRQAYMTGYDDGFSGRDQNSGYRDHGGADRNDRDRH